MSQIPKPSVGGRIARACRSHNLRVAFALLAWLLPVATGLATDIPQPVSSHPRLWITTNDLPYLRAWATTSNRVYCALTNKLAYYISEYNTT